MSQIKKFQVPYKSPGCHVTDWVQQTCRGQKTPQNQIVVKTPKAPKKIKPKRNEEPGSPKTPSFKLYGIKSPCRRRINLDLSSRLFCKSPRSQNLYSQSTTPGYTPAQFIKNFRARIGVSPARASDKDQAAETTAANAQSEMSPFITAETLGEVHDDENESQENQDDERSERSISTRGSQYCDVYDLPMSPESQRRIKNKRRTKRKQDKTKEHVLKVLNRTRIELQELRRRHREILVELGAAEPVPSSTPKRATKRVGKRSDEQSPIAQKRHLRGSMFRSVNHPAKIGSSTEE